MAVINFNNVDFPAPDGPVTKTSSPALISKVMFCNAPKFPGLYVTSVYSKLKNKHHLCLIWFKIFACEVIVKLE